MDPMPVSTRYFHCWWMIVLLTPERLNLLLILPLMIRQLLPYLLWMLPLFIHNLVIGF